MKNDQAFPMINPHYDGNWNKDPTLLGLTKLEYFAGLAMQGDFASQNKHLQFDVNLSSKYWEQRSTTYIRAAKALISELEKHQNSQESGE